MQINKLQKLLTLSAVCLTLATGANAQTTCWGTEYTGNNGHVYCASNQNAANWYSALAWCEAQGRRVPTINELCDYNGSIWGSNVTNCPNLAGVPDAGYYGRAFCSSNSVAGDETKIYSVDRGAVDQWYEKTAGGCRAVCG